jgi:predicted dehydrogenase
MGTEPAHLSRRRFLRRTSLAAGALSLPVFLPSAVLGRAEAAPPNSRINVAGIGLGIQGTNNLRAMMSRAEVRVIAVCDVHEAQRARGVKLVNDHYGDQACAAYRDYRELMQRSDLDAVLICAPDHWHPLMTLEAARRGKHIYCEKPMGWSFRAAQAARQAVHDHKVVFQFGTQQRSDRKFRLACELVRNGRIGPLKTILVGVPGSVSSCPIQPAEPVPRELDYSLWLGPAPQAPYAFQRCRPYTDKDGWSNWYSISDYCLGMIGNWGVHHLDIAQWANNTELGGPVEIEGTGVFPKGLLSDCAVSWQVRNRFANGVTLVHMDDATSQKHPLQVGGFGHGITFLGAEGWVFVRRGHIEARPESLLQTVFGANDVRLPRSEDHHGNFVDAIKGRAQPAAPIDPAVRVDTLCNLQQIAIKLGRKLRWDPVAQVFPNDEEANRLLDRPMRSPWTL